MIDSLSIQNFQSHEKTELEFDEGINIIIGQSDSGKSAILRALNWVVNNKPNGEAFKSNWGGDTKVKIIIEE
jgi:exonuclease SbcC